MFPKRRLLTLLQLLSTMAAVMYPLLIRKEIPIREFMTNGFSFVLIGGIMYALIRLISGFGGTGVLTMAIQVAAGGALYMLLAAFYMIKIRHEPVLFNEGLKLLHVKYRFK